MTVLQGDFLVLGIPSAMSLEHADVHDFLKKADSNQLGSCQTWQLAPGDSLFVSFGTVPLPVHVVASNLEKQERGAKKRTTQEKAVNRGTVIVSVLCDKTLDKTLYSPEVLSLAHAGFLRNQAYCWESVRARLRDSGYVASLDVGSASSVSASGGGLVGENH